jgi:hypothetical protein
MRRRGIEMEDWEEDYSEQDADAMFLNMNTTYD